MHSNCSNHKIEPLDFVWFGLVFSEFGLGFAETSQPELKQVKIIHYKNVIMVMFRLDLIYLKLTINSGSCYDAIRLEVW